LKSERAGLIKEDKNVSKKDRWDKFHIFVGSIAVPLIIAFFGWYLAGVYQKGRSELAKTQIELGIITSLINGNEDERKLALDFAVAIARRFNDEDFKRIVLEVSGVKDPSPEVRKVAKRPLLQLLREILNSARINYDAGHFYDAAQEYESATRFIPPDSKVDRSLLEKARNEVYLEPKKACIFYQQFFARLSK